MPEHEAAAPATRRRRRSAVRWRVTTLGVFVLAGGLLITSGLNADGLDLRASSVTDLDTLVRQEAARTDALQTRVGDLNDEVSALTRRVDDRTVDRIQQRVGRVRPAAGMTRVSGPGLVVRLDDAPRDRIDEVRDQGGDVKANDLIVHQQDIQAVANALWAGGARALSIQNQRVVSTTGIKCVGNTVVLQGVPYAPPYYLTAVGDPAALEASLDADGYVGAYRVVAQRYGLEYRSEPSSDLTVPAFEGSTELRYARPAP